MRFTLWLYLVAFILGIIAILMVDYDNLVPLAVVLIWPAFISGANAVREMASYGLGTGTASIGYWGAAVGTTIAIISNNLSPYSGVLGAFMVGAITGICAQKIIKMKIPVMILDSAILASSTAIIAIFLITLINVVYVYPLIYIAITLAILHPYNGSMGAGENQRRTLRLSAVEASITTGLFGLIVILLLDTLTGVSIVIVSAAGFMVFLARWFKAVREDIYEITYTGYPPAEH